MRKAILILVVGALVLLPGISVAGERFDGKWHTKLTCPPKGNTEGYIWQFDSIIQNSNFRGERGTAEAAAHGAGGGALEFSGH